MSNRTSRAVMLAGLLYGGLVLAIILVQEGPMPSQGRPVLLAQGLLLLCYLASLRWRRAGTWATVVAAALLSATVVNSGLVTVAGTPGYGLAAALLGAAILALPQLLLALSLLITERRPRPT